MRLRLPLPVFFLSSEDPAKMYVMKISGYALSERTVTGPLIDDFAWSMSQVGLHSYVSGGFFNPLRFIQLLQNFAGDFY